MSAKTYLVARREYVENLRTKTFWIGIFFFPVLITAMIMIPIWLEQTKDVRTYAVLDRSGWLLEAVEKRAAMPDLEAVLRTALKRYRDQDTKLERLPAELREMVVIIEQALAAGVGDSSTGPRQQREGEVIQGLAAAIAGIAGPEGETLRAMLPAEAVDELLRLREAIHTWWAALPPDQADDFGSSLSRARYRRVELPEQADAAATMAELNGQVGRGELFAYFVIAEDPVRDDQGCKYVSGNLTDEDLRRWFARLASDVVRGRRLATEKIAEDVAQWLAEPLRFEVRKIGADGAEEEVKTQDMVRQWAPVAFVYLLWMAVFMISQMLLTNTIEEKSNRIMEVLLSSMSPLQLLAGKISGIAATGLTMVGSWVIFFFLAVKYIPRLMGAELEFDLGVIATDPIYIGSFLVYFVLGYLLYSALLVGIGSVCSSLKEAQNLNMPVTILLLVPVVSMVPICEDPNGSLAKVMSYIPPFTPFVMMNRAAGPPTPVEYVATTVLLLAAILLALWGAAKIFRIGILMTGKPPRLSEILRWMRAPVNPEPEQPEPR